jgi:inner membrane transporter RhtA
VLGLVFALMNLSLYTAIDRIGLGLAVTLEFLGPLAIALAGTRRLLDLARALGAGVGVYVLVRPDASTGFVGLGVALLAAACWASYIMLNPARRAQVARSAGHGCRQRGIGTAVPPVRSDPAGGRTAHGRSLGLCRGSGCVELGLPFVLDLTALRTVPARFFGIFMSSHPDLAVLPGVAILHQVPAVHGVVGIGIVVGTNIIAVSTLHSTRARRTP